MAEMNTNTSNHHGKPRSKKLSTRVDMTPMVDLGFLLITFFMLTTTMAQPKTIDLIMPAEGKSMPVPESKALTVLLTGDNRIAYYEGDGSNADAAVNLQYTTYSTQTGIGDVIRKKQQRVADKYGDADQLIVLIKADEKANYSNVVNVMDEMLINRVARYAIVDITDNDQGFLHPMP
ncbi:biopolymer transporter ExbD [Chitinophaga horti]|uniref:Biopolymer transporter ExbD n=1 Tax=Chitinophaga horti TaxID=2920382 RepID=A0ABY6IZ31_9BACT|nr:biopolymer transporter ExbD [Chitinophaga horti]UYQ92533.1 biopolymer transporter ExbD [Chitinophaga horti]